LTSVPGVVPGEDQFADLLVKDGFLYIVTQYSLDHKLIRYKLSEPFDLAASYEVYDTHQIHPSGKTEGFFQAVALGDYIYYTPSHNTIGIHGNIVRYDASAEANFTDTSKYAYFDTEANLNGITYTRKACSDGVRYVYFLEYVISGAKSRGKILKYDSQLDFLSPDSYEIIDFGLYNSDYPGYYGDCLVHGDYLYTYMYTHYFVRYKLN
jgi:hypothetical protein